MREEKFMNLQEQEMLDVDGGRSLVTILPPPILPPLGIRGALGGFVGAAVAAGSALVSLAE